MWWWWWWCSGLDILSHKALSRCVWVGVQGLQPPLGLKCLPSHLGSVLFSKFYPWHQFYQLAIFVLFAIFLYCFPFEKSVTLALKPVIVLPLGQAAQNELAGCHGYLPRDASALVYLWPVCARSSRLARGQAIPSRCERSARGND